MKNFVALCLLLILALPALAVEDGQVMYVGGTVPGVTAHTIGQLDTTSETALVFEYSGNKFAMSYDAIESFQYSKEVTRHLGVLPAIAIGLVRMRRQRHFFRISYHDANNVKQTAVLEVSKHAPRTLQAVLETKAPQTRRPCRPCAERQ
jgi:hypothetical protein